MEWNNLEKGIFLVNVLGIIYDSESKTILIGKRETDPHIQNLSWVFPGGRADYDCELEERLKKQIKEKTNLEVIVKEIVFAKTYPEKREILSIYYLCSVQAGESRAGGSIKELKWIKPNEVKDYFTTSLHPRVEEYLLKLN